MGSRQLHVVDDDALVRRTNRASKVRPVAVVHAPVEVEDRRWWVAGVIAALLLLAGVVRWQWPSTEPLAVETAAHAPVLESPGRVRLMRVLSSLARARTPEERHQMLAGIQEEEIAPAVRELLIGSDTRDYLQVCSLVTAMQMRSMRDVVAAHTRAPGRWIGPTSLRTAHALVPYEWDELAPFLQGKPEMVAAALECLPTVEGREAAPIARLLGHRDSAIREAAILALPADPGREALALILESAQSQDAGIASAAQRALLRLDWESERLPFDELFQHAGADFRLGMLERVARDGRAWITTGAMLAAAIDEGPAEVRILAFHCLEVLGAPEVSTLRSVAADLPPMLRYHAARCLLRDHRQPAVDLLVELAEEPETADGAALAARDEARNLLAWITGTLVDAPVQEWIAWFAANQGKPLPELLPVVVLH